MDDKIRLTLLLKLNQLKKDGLANCELDFITSYLEDMKWQGNRPDNLSTIVNDILKVEADQIVRYLSIKAIVDSQYRSLNDFDFLLEGE